MDDIRSKRYKLRQVMIDGAIPPKVKKDAHDVILDFIRSRPPLRPVRIFGHYIRLDIWKKTLSLFEKKFECLRAVFNIYSMI